jgi:hypothetical protein
LLKCLTFVLLAPAFVRAEPVTVRFTEGVTRGFPVLRTQNGEIIAQGDLVQIAHADRVENRLTFRFRDGSVYDEAVTFDQRGVFTLLTYRLVQRGPSFPERKRCCPAASTSRRTPTTGCCVPS